MKSSKQDNKPVRLFAINPNQSPHRADLTYVAYSGDSDHTVNNSNQSDQRSSDGNNSEPRLSVRDDSFTDLRESLLEP